MTVKIIDVNKLVLTPNKDIYCEPKMNRKGQILVDEEKNLWKFQHQLDKIDAPVYEDKKIGDIITHALDQLDKDATGALIRQRFALSCRVEDAMSNGGLLKVEQKDWQCIEGTLENIKNPLFNYRIQEAIDTAMLDNKE